MNEIKSLFFLQKNYTGFCIDKSIRIITSGFFLVCLLLTIGQDYLQSSIYHSRFYLSESFLFTLHWLLFIPVCHLLFLADKNHNKRKSLFFITGIIIGLSLFHLLIFSLLIFGFSAIFFDHTYAFLPELKRGLAEDFYKYLIAYTVLTILFFFLKINAPVKSNAVSLGYTQTIRVHDKGRYVPVQVTDILYIQTDHPYIRITTNGGTYLHNESLSGLFARLDKTCFFRIHRSAIIQISQVKSFRSRLNGDYDVMMNNGETLRLSRNFSAGFKRHFSAQTVQHTNSSSQAV